MDLWTCQGLTFSTSLHIFIKVKELSCPCWGINSWTEQLQKTQVLFLIMEIWTSTGIHFLYSFTIIIFCSILTKSMLIKGRRKGLFCLLWGTKVNKSLGYIQSSSLFWWQEQYRKSWCSFWEENNSPYTASLLLDEILEICSTEGEENSAAHSALLLRKCACMTACMRIRNERNPCY